MPPAGVALAALAAGLVVGEGWQIDPVEGAFSGINKASGGKEVLPVKDHVTRSPRVCFYGLHARSDRRRPARRTEACRIRWSH